MQTSHHHRIVLHIDDDEDDRELVREGILKKDKNIIVRQVDNGKAGLSFLRQAKEFGDLPCLIVLDLNMPGMDGRDVLFEIKKDSQLAKIPLVIFTTSCSEIDKFFAQRQGVELITKPSTLPDFFHAMEKVIAHC